MPELQPGQFELIIAAYGYEHNGFILSRRAAERIAKALQGDYQEAVDNPISTKWRVTKVASYRLEDHTPDGTKGRVIAICEPVEKHPEPYAPQGMEG